MSVSGLSVRDYPQLVAEWHPYRNGQLAPEDLTAGSNRKVWWRCRNGHEFYKSPNGRTNNQRRTNGVSCCPGCREQNAWTWDRIVDTAKKIVAKEGRLPPAGRVQRMGYAMLVQCLYKLGKTWEDLRTQVSSFESSSFVSSRNGMRWRSHPEASFSNYLYARGVTHGKGRKYPKSYAQRFGKKYGYYDLWFADKKGRKIDVEVWGDKPHGHNEEKYKQVRLAKEQFNQGRNDFLGIHFLECYSDDGLSGILEPWIGRILPFQFDRPYDTLVETSHWSNADEVIETCRFIAQQAPNGKFPTEEWLRKRGRWANRPGPTYNTLAIYIRTWVGGVRRLRQILGQSEHSTIQWNRSLALQEFRKWWEKYGASPHAIRKRADRGIISVDKEELRRGARIASAVSSYAGGPIAACKAIGVKPSRRKSS